MEGSQLSEPLASASACSLLEINEHLRIGWMATPETQAVPAFYSGSTLDHTDRRGVNPVACSVRVGTEVLRIFAMLLYLHRRTRRTPRPLRPSTISPVDPVKTGVGDQSGSRSKRGRSRLIGGIPGLCDGNNSRHSVVRMAGHRDSGTGAASFLPGRSWTGVCDEKEKDWRGNR